MGTVWDNNDELSAEDDLVATDHRDADFLEPEADAMQVETSADSPREAMQELGDDVASSPARRGHEPTAD